MFPFHEDKVKSDEYGEIINYEDFMDIRNTHSIMSYIKKNRRGFEPTPNSDRYEILS